MNIALFATEADLLTGTPKKVLTGEWVDGPDGTKAVKDPSGKYWTQFDGKWNLSVYGKEINPWEQFVVTGSGHGYCTTQTQNFPDRHREQYVYIWASWR